MKKILLLVVVPFCLFSSESTLKDYEKKIAYEFYKQLNNLVEKYEERKSFDIEEKYGYYGSKEKYDEIFQKLKTDFETSEAELKKLDKDPKTNYLKQLQDLDTEVTKIIEDSKLRSIIEDCFNLKVELYNINLDSNLIKYATVPKEEEDGQKNKLVAKKAEFDKKVAEIEKKQIEIQKFKENEDFKKKTKEIQNIREIKEVQAFLKSKHKLEDLLNNNKADLEKNIEEIKLMGDAIKNNTLKTFSFFETIFEKKKITDYYLRLEEFLGSRPDYSILPLMDWSLQKVLDHNNFYDINDYKLNNFINLCQGIEIAKKNNSVISYKEEYGDEIKFNPFEKLEEFKKLYNEINPDGASKKGSTNNSSSLLKKAGEFAKTVFHSAPGKFFFDKDSKSKGRHVVNSLYSLLLAAGLGYGINKSMKHLKNKRLSKFSAGV